MAKNERHDSPAARRGARFTMIAFVAFTAAFIALSTWQVASQVFGAHATVTPPSNMCALEVMAFELEVDSAVHRASGAHNPQEARDLFWEQLNHGEAVSKLDHRCPVTGPEGNARMAAMRFLDASESAALAQTSSLGSIRRSLEAYGPQR